MSNLSKADVSQVVKNEVAQLQNELRTIREAVQRVDRRTDDLDHTQREVKELFNHLRHVISQLEAIMQQVRAGDANSESRTHNLHDTKLRVQNIEKGIAQIVQYLQAAQLPRQNNDDSQYRR